MIAVMSLARPLATGALLLAPTVVEDERVCFEVPEGWTASGEAGEYWLESEPDVASLLLLPPDAARSLEEILAEIEVLFLSSGRIEPRGAEVLRVDGDDVHVRRYRFEPAGEDDAAFAMHQYSFERDAVHVLLQVETPPEREDPDALFEAIHRSLEIRRAPDPFGEAVPDSAGG